MSDQLRVAGRLFVAPLAVAVLAGIELRQFGAFMAAAGAYLVFVGAQFRGRALDELSATSSPAAI